MLNFKHTIMSDREFMEYLDKCDINWTWKLGLGTANRFKDSTGKIIATPRAAHL